MRLMEQEGLTIISACESNRVNWAQGCEPLRHMQLKFDLVNPILSHRNKFCGFGWMRDSVPGDFGA